jgi:tetratricopeptide (TPR) repeat protein
MWTHRLVRVALVCCLLCVFPARAEKQQSWVEVRSPHFIVVSNAGEKQAQKVAVEFEQIRAVFRQALPFTKEHESPVVEVFAVKDENSLRELLPEFWAKGHSHPGGIFFERLNKFYVGLRTDVSGPSPYETIYHEYFHALTLPYFPEVPLWLAEGLADFYGNTEILGKEAGLGRASGSLLGELREGHWIPLDVLLKVDHSSPYYNEQNKTNVFYAESWALTHYLMIGDNLAHRKMLNDYLIALGRGSTQEEASQKAFGSLKELQGHLQNYVEHNAFYYLKMKSPPEITDKTFPARLLSPAESAARRGDFFAHRGRPEEARSLLEEALRLDPKLAFAHESMGVLDYFQGNHAEALRSISQAVELDPSKYLTRYLRAYLTVSQNRFSADPSEVESDLRKSIELAPNFAPAYVTLAQFYANQGEKLSEALAFARKAVDLEPGTLSYRLTFAQVLLRMNRVEDALAVGQSAQKFARSPQERAETQSFLSAVLQYKEMMPGRGTNEVEAASEGEPADTDSPPSTRSWPVLRKGDTNTESTTSSRESLGSAKEEGPPKPSDGGPQALRRRRVAAGTVIEVTCADMALDLTVQGDQLTLKLHAENYSKVEFISTTFDPDKVLHPCTDLKGLKAKITYVLLDNARYAGEIQSVHFEK